MVVWCHLPLLVGGDPNPDSRPGVVPGVVPGRQSGSPMEGMGYKASTP